MKILVYNPGGEKMRTLEDIAEQLKECKERIKHDFRAEIIGIFGSYARGEQKEGSDVDILARFEKGATIFDLSGLVNFLEEKLGTKVDVVSERAIRQELKEEILREVVMI